MLYGNKAADGSIVKTAGVDKDNLTFYGSVKVYESQDGAVEAILGGNPLRRAKRRAGYARNAVSNHLFEVDGIGWVKSVR